jgi:uncharacterized protein (TIGR00369 family)
LTNPERSWRAQDWDVWDLADPFEAANGAIHRSVGLPLDTMELVRIGFRVGPHNCNMLGTCHGGLVASLMDIAMGRNAWEAAGRASPTISMTVDFVRAVQAGEWIESRARVIRKARRFVFCDGILLGDKGIVARGNGVFAIPDVPAG